MTTVQAIWFRADEHPEGGEPDYQAFTQMDVLNIADRLLAASLTRSRQAFSFCLVKTCGGGDACRQSSVERAFRSFRKSSLSILRTRSSAAAARFTATRSSIRRRCVERACPFLYSFVELGRTYVGCMQKVFNVEIDLVLMLKAGPARRASVRCERTGSRCRCASVEVESCYEGREDELGCVNPEFHELPLGEPSFRIFAQVRPSA